MTSFYNLDGEPRDGDLALLSNQLRSKDKKTRGIAAQRLIRIGKPALPVLIAALKDHNDKVRGEAAYTLKELGPEAREAVPDLVAALSDPTTAVTEWAAQTLGYMGPDAREAVPALIACVQKSGSDSAVWALGTIGPDAKAAVPVLTKRLEDPDGGRRAGAARALANIGVASDTAAKRLARIVQGDDYELARIEAAWALGSFRTGAKIALPALLQQMKDRKDKLGSAYAAYAVKRIDPQNKAAVPILIEALRQENAPLVRGIIVGFLGGLGPDASEAVPPLTELLSDKQLRADVAEALDKIRGKRKSGKKSQHGKSKAKKSFQGLK